MKTQLLEDIGDNADRIVERLPLPKAAAPAADPIAAPPADIQADTPAPPEAPAQPSARVWQVRAPRGEPSYRPADAGGSRSAQFKPRTVWQAPSAPAPQPAVEPAPPPAPAVHPQDIADEVAEIERALQSGATAQARAPQTVAAGINEQEIADELAAIERALERSERASAKPARSKRWLIAAGAAGSVLLAAGLVTATVQWYQDESKNVDTMNVLATSAASPVQPPAARVAPAPSVPVLPEAPGAASVAETPAAAPPPMVMLEQPAQSVKTAALSEPAPAPAPAPAPIPAPAVQATPAPPAIEAVAPEPAPPVAKPRRKEAVARRAEDDAPQRPAPRPRPQPAVAATESAPTRDEQMEETLRQCRAAGYHTAQCLEKKCQATKYGLACRG